MTKAARQGLLFVDTEVDSSGGKLLDVGALTEDGRTFHSTDRGQFFRFAAGTEYFCGHNIVHHDIPHLFPNQPAPGHLIDTLYLSPLLFPQRPYHKLLKDDKLQSDELNNPVNDCRKAQSLFYDELNAYEALGKPLRQIYVGLLSAQPEFAGFFLYAEAAAAPAVSAIPATADLPELIAAHARNHICAHADLAKLVGRYPVELAYALALILTEDGLSITPSWVLHQYPKVENIIKYLRHTPCAEGCDYCRSRLDIHRSLKAFFGYDQFRTFDGEPMQERAVQTAVEGRSLLTIFPTGGGKSLTFQLPALMEGETVHGLTVVISPLQSLMKDQVDNLSERGITSAVTINGLLDPISRADAISRVADGTASLLYISPEMLRSKTIERLLCARQVVRFVVDEAHCFSAWGQDFRVDYLYIGTFIRWLQEKKQYKHSIPVSCFTATAKQKVISDICDYFKRTLDLDLQLFASRSSRQNLHYSVLHVDTDDEKYALLRGLMDGSNCPAIVYVSRTRRTMELAGRLSRDGFPALPFNGRMESNEKIANQNAFMSGKVRVIVATSAFGMGVDKKDVGLVVHYDISDSLENYVQEAGRAGRDPQMQARCYVLYGDQDLDKHFVLLNQTKLSLSEIQQVWRAIRSATRQRSHISLSALEIARNAGWDDSVPDIETRVRTAVSALEQAGYVRRGNNMPHVYATGIRVRNMQEAQDRLMASPLFSDAERQDAARVIKSLISSKARSSAQNDEAESRIDYLADVLGLTKETVVSVVERMRQEGILADSRDMTAFLLEGDSRRKSQGMLDKFAMLEQYLLKALADESRQLTLRQLNDQAEQQGIAGTSVKNLRTLLYFLSIKNYVRKQDTAADPHLAVRLTLGLQQSLHKSQRRYELAAFLIDQLYASLPAERTAGTSQMVNFSLLQLLEASRGRQQASLFDAAEPVDLSDIEEALLFLSKIGALRLEGGFLVLYNAMELERLKDVRLSYKKEDYRLLDEFYRQKMQQVHIVGEYANLMVRDYAAALQYVQDYFQMDYKQFIAKYFKGERQAELERNITPAKYRQLFGQLSPRQREIIDDHQSPRIVVAAGPGSGKTRVLVHKMASLLLLEEVKHEQLLMLTFSRAAAIEFKQRLIELIGNAAYFVEIKTFHSYCFDLLGRIGNLDDAKDVVRRAADLILQGEVEPSRISKSVLLIDEAQDMDQHEYALVSALMRHNEEMRLIAVGDDDQNVYQFRGADSRYMQQLVTQQGARLYEMTDNYRSSSAVVAAANRFASLLQGRMKSTPIAAVSSQEGRVEVVQHAASHMSVPLVEHLLRLEDKTDVAVLAATNEEALRIVALLRHHQVPCRLIQSMDGFRLSDLAEVRYLLQYIERRIGSPVISDDLWQQAGESLRTVYRDSACLEQMEVLMRRFEQVSRTKYLSDLQEMVLESSIEDFLPDSRGEVVVSTIHKAKGREFGTVFLYVDDSRFVSDDDMRKLYVGLTRAKHDLYIHTNGSLFVRLGAGSYQQDARDYPMPEEITLQLTHRDVFLDNFRHCKSLVLSLRSGQPLVFSANRLCVADGRPLACLSKRQQEELRQWESRGYRVASAKVRYIVAWRPQDPAASPQDGIPEPPSAKPEEVAVVLADLCLRRESHCHTSELRMVLP